MARSPHSHFPVVRLPALNDKLSQVTQSALPNLWIEAPVRADKPATVALIPPALPAVAASRLGFNNGYVDADGLLRRYRYLEPLPDGSAIQSLPLSVMRAVAPAAYPDMLARVRAAPRDALIVWPRTPQAHGHIPFADVFEQAESGKRGAGDPDFAGKIVIIGSTAPMARRCRACRPVSTRWRSRWTMP